MTIDLRSLISDDKSVRFGGFTGAIFLTYTLNLTFYEQMIAPALDQAGCANILILVDPDGYNGALEMGIKTIHSAGLRYVCMPIPRTGRGVQHAKLLLMAGPQQGRMLIGSGNLTMHGFGRNLELFSFFEYDSKKDQLADTYPFVQAWQLISRLVRSNELPFAARTQIKALQETATWLDHPAPEPTDFCIWHNFDRPILDLLTDWRNARGWASQPIRAFSIISPYYDSDIGTLQRLADDFLPDQIQIHLDPALTNLNGSQADLDWNRRETELKTAGIGPGEATRPTRHVHAKAVIGKEQDGVWCLTGSANLTRPALLRSWQNHGNLELVTFRWSQNPNAFDYLINDPSVKVWPINLADVIVTEPEPSERPTHLETPIMLTDLTARGEILDGRVSDISNFHVSSGNLHVLRKNLDIPILLDSELAFHVQLPAPLDTADAARIELGESVTPYHWIDQPEILARFGARTYQVRIKGKMETILGAEQLFQELMNYLWERVDPSCDTDEQDPRLLRRRRQESSGDQSDTPNGPLPPGPEDFITDELLVRTLHWGVEHHQPYDRSLLSLRDLLSLVLLRLTTPTQAALLPVDEGIRDEDADQQRQIEQEAQQVKILDRLRNYLIGYCKRYGHRLITPDFIHYKSPEVIFQNHFTLSRVLLEFAAKAEQVFTQGDLASCFWWIYAPLVWPEIIGFDGIPALKSLENEFSKENIQQAWQDGGMPSISIIVIYEALGQPPNWKTGLWNKKRVGEFMAAREWIDRMRKVIGDDAFHINQEHLDNALGVRSIDDVTNSSQHSGSLSIDEYQDVLTKIERYIPPVQEKYYPLVQLSDILKTGEGESQKAQELIEQIHRQGLSEEYEEYKKKPVRILSTSEDDPYCPRCGAHLTVIAQNSLKQGKLVLCTSSRDAWIYLRPKLPRSLI